jgi:hypothetical protein
LYLAPACLALMRLREIQDRAFTAYEAMWPASLEMIQEL